MADYREIAFEEEICRQLEGSGWLYSENDAGYDAERAIFPQDVIDWLAETQDEELAKVVDLGAPSAGQQTEQLLDRLVKVLDHPLDAGGGTLNVLRRGFKHLQGRFAMCQFRPETDFNLGNVSRYQAVRVRIMRQVHFSTKDRRSIDLVGFVNGLPVFTAELKSDFTQSVEEARQQYRRDRKPTTQGHREPLLSFGHRALVHFAVSNDEVWMTTRLAGEKTRFLPFNRGHNDGPGNPPDPEGGSPTSYLWRDVLSRESLLDILHRFMHLETKERLDPATGELTRSTTLLFPRYHQWEAVRKLTKAAAEEGPGHKYLVQHSAGSGKTNTISWLAHRLARLHRPDGSKVFDSVIVVTDRTVLDAQLQEAITQIDGGLKIVAEIDNKQVALSKLGSKSGLLAQSLAAGSLIIVVTIQTFPFALEEIRNSRALRGKSFAVIADEAHSSQTGKTAATLKQSLSGAELEELEVSEDDGILEIDTEAILAADMKARAESHNISFFAFTATPKQKTLELFGRKGPDGKPRPFHLYTMKQAIEEGFILDVLRGYQTYETAFLIQRTAEEEELVDEATATKKVMRWVKLHPTNIEQKVEIIVEHFREKVMGLLDGSAKAMVVADSRMAAVRYKLALDRYTERKGYRGLGILVAFSGAVIDPRSGPEPFTEAAMNPGLGGQDLRDAFTRPDQRIMVVASKFQTGFDQPLLCAMYVDKRLSGVNAVQTLSRLNRTYTAPSGQRKDRTMIIDFVNDPETILKSFEPYYAEARVDQPTDPNLVHDIESKLAAAGIYTRDDVEAVVKARLHGKRQGELAHAIGPAKERFRDAYNKAKERRDRAELERLDQFRDNVNRFIRLYDFMSQVINYGDVDLEKTAIFLRLLQRQIQPDTYSADVDLSDLDLVAIKQIDLGKTDLTLSGDGTVKPITGAGKSKQRDERKVALQEVIDKLNEIFGGDLSGVQIENIAHSVTRSALANPDIANQAAVNSPSQFAESPDLVHIVTDAFEENQEAFDKVEQFIYRPSPQRDLLIQAFARLIQAEVLVKS